MEAIFSIAKNDGDDENLHSNPAITAATTDAAAKCHANEGNWCSQQFILFKLCDIQNFTVHDTDSALWLTKRNHFSHQNVLLSVIDCIMCMYSG